MLWSCTVCWDTHALQATAHYQRWCCLCCRTQWTSFSLLVILIFRLHDLEVWMVFQKVNVDLTEFVLRDATQVLKLLKSEGLYIMLTEVCWGKLRLCACVCAYVKKAILPIPNISYHFFFWLSSEFAWKRGRRAREQNPARANGVNSCNWDWEPCICNVSVSCLLWRQVNYVPCRTETVFHWKDVCETQSQIQHKSPSPL